MCWGSQQAVGTAGAVQSSGSGDMQPPAHGCARRDFSRIKKKSKKELKMMATPLFSSPSVPGYNHVPSQYVDHYAMIHELGENDPSVRLLWGQGRECQEGPAGPFGSPLLRCSWRAAGLQADGIS